MICFKASYGNVLWQECKADSSGDDKDATIRILRMVTCFFKVMSWTWSIDAWIDAWKSLCSDETTTSPEVASNSQGNAIHRVIGLSSLWKSLLKKMQDTKFGECWTFHRRLEDEMAYWIGPVFVKIARIIINLIFSIHIFCCGYWRVKVCCQHTMVDECTVCINSLEVRFLTTWLQVLDSEFITWLYSNRIGNQNRKW